jgi:DNA-binding NarL/FixJ family response regulator
MRVAIADDTPDIRLLVRMTLELDPEIVVVAEAEDGCGAIRIVAEHAPDVLVLDLSMPVMNGLEALPHVIEASPSTAVVVLSGFSLATAQQALAAGARGYVRKGVPGAELRRRVREAVAS